LAVDASATHVGAVLQQRSSPHHSWRPLGFFSKKLSPAAVKYSAFDRELLAAFEAVRHFRHQLEGTVFHILTDHKPLTFAISRQSDPWTPSQSRRLSYLAEFTADVRHIAGTDNVVADTLSRPPQRPPATSPGSSMAAGPQGESVASIVPSSPSSTGGFQPHRRQSGGLRIGRPSAPVNLPTGPSGPCGWGTALV
jgi:hypothetical protein